jgi:sulfide:quinone oxidoreductase
MRVVIAGGGVAGLETLMAVRSLAGDLVELTLIAPDDEFVYRPVAVEEPFAVGRARRLMLQTAAHQAGASFSAATVDAVDPEARTVTTSAGERLEYDALVLAVGAEVMPAVSNALTWDDRSDAEMVGGLLRDLEDGYSRSLAIVIPPGPGWPLRGYELALFITLQARTMGAELRTTIIRPEPPPLAALGSRATTSIAKELERAGVSVVGADDVTVEREHTATVVLEPSGQRLEVDRVLALPVLRGRHVTGLPADGSGFVEVDEHCRVRGLRGIWAVGDATAFPLKSGGFAAEQADVAAEDIAAAAGAAVEPRTFDPARDDLAGLPAGRFLREAIGGHALDLPVSAVPVLTYLQRDLVAGWRGYG